jgi:hypothetical protein
MKIAYKNGDRVRVNGLKVGNRTYKSVIAEFGHYDSKLRLAGIMTADEVGGLYEHWVKPSQLSRLTAQPAKRNMKSKRKGTIARTKLAKKLAKPSGEKSTFGQTRKNASSPKRKGGATISMPRNAKLIEVSDSNRGVH